MEPAGIFVLRIVWQDGREETFSPTTPAWVHGDVLSFYLFTNGGTSLAQKHISLAGVRGWETEEMQRIVPAASPSEGAAR